MRRLLLGTLIGAIGAAPAAGNEGKPPFNTLPEFISSDIRQAWYDGLTDDLLTAGLGADGLASATPPAFDDALNPTPAELRRLAIYNNYRALVDGVAVSEPNINPQMEASFTIRQGNGPIISGHSRSLLDYTAALSETNVPDIQDRPPESDLIVFADNQLNIPD
ncbi:MAG: 3-hydroxybutyrate oligomer hydrolase family protein [Marinobacter sp.]